MGVGQLTNEKIIEKRQESEHYKYFKYGDDYYKSRNTEIMQRRKLIYSETYGVTDNPFMANHQLPMGHLRPIVDQKVNYLLGNGVMFEEEQNLDAYFQNGFYEDLIALGTTASKKAEAWLYMYKKDGQLKFVEIPPEQIACKYDEYGGIEKIIRIYDETMLVYTKDKVEKFAYKDKKWNKTDEYGHYSKKTKFRGVDQKEEMQSFGVVPFIPLYNNRERISDLYPIKPMIDVRDIVNSDFANNIDDMQDAFFVLKGYAGDSKDLVDFIKELKRSKAIPISTDGDVTAQQLQIPTEARKTFLDRIDRDIYKSAMAVDMEAMTSGDVTNVGIMAMTMNLDLKTDQFETEVRKTIRTLIDYINRFDNKAFTNVFKFERSTIVNKEAYVESISKVHERFSTELLLKLLPFEINVEEELARQEEEKAINPIRLGDADDSTD